MNFSRRVLLGAFLLSFPSLAVADEVDDARRKIEEVTKVFETDAGRYERLYKDELASIVNWRVGWEWLVEVSDNAYALDVFKSKLKEIEGQLDYLSSVGGFGAAWEPPPEMNGVISSTIYNNERLVELENLLKGRIDPCGSEATKYVARNSPLNSIAEVQGPDVGTFPSMHHHPSLYLKFTITEEGNVYLSPDSGVGQRTDPSNKHTIPGTASTVSAAAWLYVFGEKGGEFGYTGASFFGAAAAAMLVYVTVEWVQANLKDGELADAVAKMNKAIQRIYAAQRGPFMKMEQDFESVVRSVCTSSFQAIITKQQARLEQLSSERTRLIQSLDAERARIGSEVTAGGSWNKLECEIFGCSGDSGKAVATLGIRELTKLYGED